LTHQKPRKREEIFFFKVLSAQFEELLEKEEEEKGQFPT